MTIQVMSTFCTKPLAIWDNNNIVLKPDYKPPQTRALTFISFLKVPLETEENEMTHYVKEHCDVHRVHYPRQCIGDITYHTGTRRVYHCFNIKEHFSTAVHIFRRLFQVICDGQSDRNWKPYDTSEEDEKNESAQQNNQLRHSPAESPTIIKETPASQVPTPTLIPETRESQIPTSTSNTT